MRSSDGEGPSDKALGKVELNQTSGRFLGLASWSVVRGLVALAGTAGALVGFRKSRPPRRRSADWGRGSLLGTDIDEARCVASFQARAGRDIKLACQASAAVATRVGSRRVVVN